MQKDSFAIDPDPRLDAVLQRLFNFYPVAIDLKTDRILRLLARFDNPHLKLPPVIHVAGTNGKGSVIAFIRAMCEAAGLKCHVLTSPHLVRFNERIVVASKDIETEALLKVLARCEEANAQEPITFFELTTVAPMLAFTETPADVCILETGMGGRFDATNVVPQPLATAITMISYDHMQYLGDTLAKIAFEKAGIMKRGVPCITGYQTPQAIAEGVPDVFDAEAQKAGAQWLAAERDWKIENNIFTYGDFSFEFPPLALKGAHQLENAGVALVTLHTVKDTLKISETAMREGLQKAQWRGRLQKLTHGPLVNALDGESELWLDGAHNDSGAATLAAQFEKWKNEDDKPLHIIMGMVMGKEKEVFLRQVLPYAETLTMIDVPENSKSMKAAELADAAKQCDFTKPVYVRTAEDCIGVHNKKGRIMICGSLYLAGAILRDNA